MACGAPIIALDTPYNREVLSSSGLFVPRSVSAIVTMVSNLMMDGRRQDSLSSAAKERARLYYSWGDVCKQYLTCLEIFASLSARVRPDSLE
jgi:glycosyltransferase involved in cell wall biosynthesis